MTKNIEKYLNAQKVDISDWEKIASSTLKNMTLKDLNKKIDKDLTIKPLYTSNDEEDDYSHSSRRGLKSNKNDFMPWFICTTVDHHKDPKILNNRILGELERGSNSVELSCFEENTLDLILNNIDLSIAPIFIRNINYSKENFFNFVKFIKENKNKKINCNYQIDPFASNLWLEEFSKNKTDDEKLNYEDILKYHNEINNEFKNIDLIHLDGGLWNDLGANTSEEIELLCLSFLEVIKGFNYKNNRNFSISITLTADTDFFTSIAKIRATRIIFGNIFKNHNINCSLNITSRSSSNILFKKDPWVNQLRITTAALASAIGGSSRIICNNITQKLGQAPDFIRRLTRNMHIILQEESRISRVQDPSGGSFYIENLTNNIAKMVWKKLQLSESNGGILDLISSKNFRQNLKKSRDNFKKNVKEQKLIKVGENSYEDPESNPINVKPFES